MHNSPRSLLSRAIVALIAGFAIVVVRFSSLNRSQKNSEEDPIRTTWGMKTGLG